MVGPVIGPKAMDMSGTLDIYTQFFELKERPFSLVPDPGFLFWSPRHERAYTMLEYGIMTHAPITLITGEVGAGKTTLLHHLLNTMESNVQIGLISNAHGDRGELLRWVLMALDQRAAPEAGYVDLFAQFQDYLIAQYGQGRRVILIFDEAQNLTLETLEELRMFTNINSNKDELLQLILVGQPELRTYVQRPELRQFAQRVAASYHIEALTPEMVVDYIRHRLEVAGAREPIFDEPASALVAEASRGVPRLINQLCDLSMVYAFTLDRKTVTLEVVEQVLDDGVFFAGGLDTAPPSSDPRPGSKWTAP
jgi:type II secretory pathway predicted ATPase ExeA